MCCSQAYPCKLFICNWGWLRRTTFSPLTKKQEKIYSLSLAFYVVIQHWNNLPIKKKIEVSPAILKELFNIALVRHFLTLFLIWVSRVNLFCSSVIWPDSEPIWENVYSQWDSEYKSKYVWRLFFFNSFKVNIFIYLFY